MENDRLPTPFKKVWVTFFKQGEKITKIGFYSCLYGVNHAEFQIIKRWVISSAGEYISEALGECLKPWQIYRWDEIE